MNLTDNLYSDGIIINYEEGDKSLERYPRTPVFDLLDKLYTVKDNDTLTSLAYYFYGSGRLWWVIADNNLDVIDNIFDIPSGTQLIIPNYKNLV